MSHQEPSVLYRVDLGTVSEALEVPVQALQDCIAAAAAQQQIQNNAGDISSSPTIRSPLLPFTPKSPKSPSHHLPSAGSRNTNAVIVTTAQVAEEGATPSSDDLRVPGRRDSKVLFSVTTLSDGDRTESSLARQARRASRKRVHFPADVIQSITIIQDEAILGDDGEPTSPSTTNSLRLQVNFNRPLWAYAMLVVSTTALALSWVEIAMAAYPSKLPRQSSAKSATAVCSAVFGFTTIAFLVYLALTWRPGRAERNYITVTGRRNLGWTVFSGAVASTSLVASYAVHVSCVNFVAFSALPLVASFLSEMWSRKIIAPVDSAGTVLVVAGLVVLVAGEEHADQGKLRARLFAALCAVISAMIQSSFLASCRRTSKDVSITFIATATLAATTAICVVSSLALGGFSAPLGARLDHPSLLGSSAAGGGSSSWFSASPAEIPGNLAHLSYKELIHVGVACGTMFAAWFFQHLCATYFDRLSLAAGLSLGAPYMIVAYHIAGLPYAVIGFEVAGSLLVFVGTVGVIYAGWKHRAGVEIVIDLASR